MNHWTHILAYEWKILMRSRTVLGLLLITLGAGIYGIYFGKFEIEKQAERIAEVQAYEQKQFEELMTWAKLDTSIAENKKKYEQATSPTGVGWNKHFTYFVANEAHPAAGLCLGQRDLFPVYYGFNITDLARQLNVGELANPMRLLTGNFDLSYVLIFLLPLLIISLFYNLYAAEKEGGTLPLLRAQFVSATSVFIVKGGLRFLLVLGIASLLLSLGFLLHDISISKNAASFFQFSGLTYAYCALWTALIVGIVALKRSAALSAMLGLGLWLILVLVTPALLNLYLSAKTPLPNRAKLIHNLRNLNDQNWESPKSFVFDQFYSKHPEYPQGDTTNFNKWYYASFTLLDEEAQHMNQAFETQIAERNDLIRSWIWLAPAAALHEQFTHIAETNRDSHQAFLEEITTYHAELKSLYYARIFEEQPFSEADLKILESRLIN
ncbi:MAG: DUF3526 domain-containing protein [Bacteroidota bacterium]